MHILDCGKRLWHDNDDNNRPTMGPKGRDQTTFWDEDKSPIQVNDHTVTPIGAGSPEAPLHHLPTCPPTPHS